MAELDSELAKFHSEIGPNIGTMKGSATTLKSDLTTSKGKYQQALSTITSAWKSSDSSGTKSLLQLLVDANERLETSVGSDLISGLDDCQTLDDLISKLISLIDHRNSLEPGEWIEVNGERKYDPKDDEEIKKTDKEIEFYDGQCKGLLKAIESGFSRVSLGIVGNIKGGSLGKYGAYENGFKLEEYKEPSPSEQSADDKSKDNNGNPTFGQVVSGFLVGTAESVLNLGEGIVDAGALLVADVFSAFGGEKVAQKISDFIKMDLSDKAGDALVETLNADEAWRQRGQKLGRNVAIVASAACPALIPFVAVGFGGEAAEYTLSGEMDKDLSKWGIETHFEDNLLVATGASAVVGISSAYGLDKLSSVFHASSVAVAPGTTAPLALPPGNAPVAGYLGPGTAQDAILLGSGAIPLGPASS